MISGAFRCIKQFLLVIHSLDRISKLDIRQQQSVRMTKLCNRPLKWTLLGSSKNQTHRRNRRYGSLRSSTTLKDLQSSFINRPPAFGLT